MVFVSLTPYNVNSVDILFILAVGIAYLHSVSYLSVVYNSKKVWIMPCFGCVNLDVATKDTILLFAWLLQQKEFVVPF